MAKEKVKNKTPSKKYAKYKVEGGKIMRGETCPKCGEGIFLANHRDRNTCGKCRYTEFKKRE